ncbi:MAG: anti-sigma regulatory factor [Bacteroidetes bacterium]|nr:MAG: anti-sigma regulatory factor [Bacteroidota bacterium]
MQYEFFIEGGDFSKAGTASSQLKRILKQLNINPAIIRKTVVALYEAEVNVVAHAYEGKIQVDLSPSQIKIIIEDKGPGIPNIDLAMQEGFSTASKEVREMGFGAGMGIPNIKNNCDDLKISTVVGESTRLEITTAIS